MYILKRSLTAVSCSVSLRVSAETRARFFLSQTETFCLHLLRLSLLQVTRLKNMLLLTGFLITLLVPIRIKISLAIISGDIRYQNYNESLKASHFMHGKQYDI